MTKGLKKVDLAHALGVDPSLITRYTERGMPTISVAAALDWKLKNVRPRVKVANIENPGLFDYDQARAKRSTERSNPDGCRKRSACRFCSGAS